MFFNSDYRTFPLGILLYIIKGYEYSFFIICVLCNTFVLKLFSHFVNIVVFLTVFFFF